MSTPRAISRHPLQFEADGVTDWAYEKGVPGQAGRPKNKKKGAPDEYGGPRDCLAIRIRRLESRRSDGLEGAG